MLQIYFDGACGPKNPGGKAGWGWVAYRNETIIEQAYGYVGEGPAMSNNVAEYSAILAALLWSKTINEPIEFLGDSMLVISQMSGRWKIRRGLYEKYAREAWRLRRSNHRFTWIPRERNSIADALSVLGAGYRIDDACLTAVDHITVAYRERLEREL